MNPRAVHRAVLLLGLSLGACVGAAREPAKAPFRHLRLDLQAKTIEFDGTFCHGEYPLELLVCQGTLRDYEAMISSPCEPSSLHAALLALNLKPRVHDKEDPRKLLREGDPLDVRIRFTRDGKEVTVAPSELIVDLETQRHITENPFVFYGSFLFPDHRDKTKTIYLADAEDWLIGLLGDTASVIDLAAGHTGRYGALQIDTKTAPPKGSKATLIIRPAAATQPGQAKPPETQPDAKPERLVVNIQKNGDIVVGGEKLDEKQLRDRLAARRPVLLRAHRAVSFQRVVAVLELCAELKIRDVAIATLAGPAERVPDDGRAPIEPGEEDDDEEPADLDELQIRIQRGGTEDQPLPKITIDQQQMKDWDETRETLKRLAALPGGKKDPVRLIPDPEAKHEWVMQLLDILHQLDFQNIQFKQ